MAEHWSTKYIGLPYLSGGRTREGLDCWGLVRLVHSEEFQNELPSYAGAYDSPHDSRIDELIAEHREGWVRTDDPQPGDVVVFRVWGGLNHVGIVTEPGRFLHIRAGRDSVVDRLTSSVWAKRVEGIYRYTPVAEMVSVAGLPHPLRTVRLDGEVPAGLTLAEIQEWVYQQTATPGETHRSPAIITIDGEVIPPARWAVVKPKSGQRVEYRAIAEGDSFRSILQIGVLVGAMALAAVVAPYLAPFLGVSLATGTALATAAISGAGALLVNYLFPVRPADNKTLDETKRKNLLEGGSNQPNPYGAVPVVLGQVRYTPPIAAINYAETIGDESYLRTVLCWGYGPLQVSDIRIGDKPLSGLKEVTTATLVGTAGESNTIFDSIYPTDTSQSVVNARLEGPEIYMSAWSRAVGGLTTVTTGTPHGLAVGDLFSIYTTDPTLSPVTQVISDTQFVYQSPITTAASGGNQWGQGSTVFTQIVDGEVNRISVSLHFPNGIFAIKIGGSQNVGQNETASFECMVQARQLDSQTLAPVSSWGAINGSSGAYLITFPTAFYNTNTDAALEAVYRWHFIVVDEFGTISVRDGAVTTDPNADPSGLLLQRLQQQNTGFNSTFQRFPTVPAGEVVLWRVCIFGGAVFNVTDMRAAAGFPITGGGLTYTGLQFTLASATYNRAVQSVVSYVSVILKDAFTRNVSFNVPTGRWEVRVYRTSSSAIDSLLTSNRQSSYEAYFVAVTGFRNTRPINPPKPLAMTAIRVRATNQLNGTVEGFIGTCTTVCLDWNGTAWVSQATRNPASLFRYVLQHPANAQAIPDAQIDLAALQSWHSYCQTNSFTCDLLVLEQRSILDVLRDVAACGRASPALRDGKWTVVVDQPQATIAQFFTPANSWGFEGQRAYPKIPHCFRVMFNNREKGYQADEMLVFDDGYTISNATLYEQLSLPGVTTPSAVYKHARFHLAQLKLRPETYSLTVDIEHLICQRGDRVRVTHDVPLWGIAAGRIKRFVTTTNLILEEPIPMDAAVQYGIRIRLENGTSITRTIAAKASDGLYSDITLTAAITATEGAAGNLYMVGTLNAESVDCIVLAVEPQENMTARLTLVDYAPAIYNSDLGVIPAFNSNITQPPVLQQSTVTATITINSIISDERVLEILSNGQYAYRIVVSYTVPATGVPANVTSVEGGIIEEVSYTTGRWRDSGLVARGAQFAFGNVQQGVSYRMRFRLVTSDGKAGPWIETAAHSVVGRLNPPSTVTGFAVLVEGPRVLLKWTANPEIDIFAYEIRTANSGWGGAGALLRTATTTVEVVPAAAGTALTWFIKAQDSANLFAVNAASATLTVVAPGVPAIPSQTINKVAAGLIVLGLDWADSTPGTLPIAGYEIRSTDTGWGTAGFLYKGATSAATIQNVSATVATTFYMRAYDTRGNYSATSRSFVHDVTAPGTMAATTVAVTRTAAVLNMRVVTPPAIPADFDVYEFRIGQVRAGATIGDNTPNAVLSGTTDNFWYDPDCTVVRSATATATVSITTFDQPRFSATGIIYRVACRMRDKSGNYSPASALGSLNVTSIV